MIKIRPGIGNAIDHLTQVFDFVEIDSSLNVKLRRTKSSEVIVSIGYGSDKPTKAAIYTDAILSTGELKAVLEYAGALEELATPSAGRIR